jgi:hypothetical protein
MMATKADRIKALTQIANLIASEVFTAPPLDWFNGPVPSGAWADDLTPAQCNKLDVVETEIQRLIKMFR